ncbi:MAG: [FeFe] hydrogenase H-cluster maturation GTPase HydF [Alphaproteobacteria bacterium]|nr:[FeFe] hydrogenase H-cluster maturation GTPase HydF [Alphaproteobacteria bacterium]
MAETAPRGERLNIGLFGRRNVGKSSLLNALCAQQISIVSDTAGTTTDAVSKIYELIPVGPVTFFDTAGIDDTGKIGKLRIAATRKIINKVDIALLITDENGIGEHENDLMKTFNDLKVPFILVFNKSDLIGKLPGKEPACPFISVCAATGNNIEALKQLIKDTVPEHLKNAPALVRDLIREGQTIVCVAPIDSSAPKGRLILPQVQVIRDILDANAYAYVVQNDQDFLKILPNLKTPPALVITDSQLIRQVNAVVPSEIALTTFSTLFARYKGDLKLLYEGAAELMKLKENDHVLIAEACSHHAQDDDIARVKIPSLIRKKLGEDIHFEWSAGSDFPADLQKFKVVIHCGGCMLSRLETLRRLNECARNRVPVTNFGMALSAMQGVLNRVVQPFGLSK